MAGQKLTRHSEANIRKQLKEALLMIPISLLPIALGMAGSESDGIGIVGGVPFPVGADFFSLVVFMAGISLLVYSIWVAIGSLFQLVYHRRK